MLDNNLYNLTAQLVEESRSAWRIKTSYEQDAANCSECLMLWKKLLAEKKRNIEQIERLIRHHLDAREENKVPSLLNK